MSDPGLSFDENMTPDPVARAKAKIADPSTSPADKAALAMALDAKGIKFDIAVNKNPIAPAIQFPDAGLTPSQQKLKALGEKLKKGDAPALPNMNPAEVTARGAAHYQSLGAADEMAGLGAQGSVEQRRLGFDERKGPVTERTTGRGIDAPVMTTQQKRDAAYQEGRAAYDARDKAAREQNAALFDASGLASEIPAIIATGGSGGAAKAGVKAALKRMAVAAPVNATVGAAGGALGAEPGERAQGAEMGALIGGTLGPIFEGATSAVRGLGRAAMDKIAKEYRAAREAGAEIGWFGMKPGERIGENISEGASRNLSASEVAAEKAARPVAGVVNRELRNEPESWRFAPSPEETRMSMAEKGAEPIANALNKRMAETTGLIHEAQQSYFASPEGQSTIPATMLNDAIDSAAERFQASDQGPLPTARAKAKRFRKLARELLQVGESGEPEARQFNAQDWTRFKDLAENSSSHGTFDKGLQGSFGELANSIRGIIAEHYPGLAAINQGASKSLEQMHGGMDVVGLGAKKKLKIDAAIAPEANVGGDFQDVMRAALNKDPMAQRALRQMVSKDPAAKAALEGVMAAGSHAQPAPGGSPSANMKQSLGLSGDLAPIFAGEGPRQAEMAPDFRALVKTLSSPGVDARRTLGILSEKYPDETKRAVVDLFGTENFQKMTGEGARNTASDSGAHLWLGQSGIHGYFSNLVGKGTFASAKLNETMAGSGNQTPLVQAITKLIAEKFISQGQWRTEENQQ